MNEMSFKFFANKDCEFYPCHKSYKSCNSGKTENFNCLFCYCPLYHFAECGGNPSFVERRGKDGGTKLIKDCSDCVFPHVAENYDKVIQRLSKAFEEDF